MLMKELIMAYLFDSLYVKILHKIKIKSLFLRMKNNYLLKIIENYNILFKMIQNIRYTIKLFLF